MATNGNQTDDVKTGEVRGPMAVMEEQTLAVDLARAEIDQAIATAHRYPRVLDTVIKKIETMACYNEQAAENCIYSLPRGGKPIIGPSIGFANIVAQAWGNCTDAARIVYIDRKEKVVIAEGGFHDLETNRKTMVPVQRRICSKDGRLFTDDMIMVTGMAASSIARRNAILNAVPRALWYPIFEEALHIIRGTLETFAESKDKALKAFAQFGVTPEKVIMALGLKGDADLTLEHIAPMRGMYSTLRSGEMTVEEMFDPRRMTGAGFETVANPLGDEEGGEPAAAETVDKETGEIKETTVTVTGAGGGAAGSGGSTEKKPRGRPRTTKEPAQVAAETQVAQTAAENAHTEVQQSGVAAAQAKTAPAPAPAAVPAKPKTAAEYKAYMAGWLSSSTSVSAIEDHWREDRGLRGECSVVEDSFTEMRAMKDARVAELAPKV